MLVLLAVLSIFTETSEFFACVFVSVWRSGDLVVGLGVVLAVGLEVVGILGGLGAVLSAVLARLPFFVPAHPALPGDASLSSGVIADLWSRRYRSMNYHDSWRSSQCRPLLASARKAFSPWVATNSAIAQQFLKLPLGIEWCYGNLRLSADWN